MAITTLNRSAFPSTRMRRMRKDAFSRRLMQETVLTPADLIYPDVTKDLFDVHVIHLLVAFRITTSWRYIWEIMFFHELAVCHFFTL